MEAAFGICGLTPAGFRHLTPSEFLAIGNGKVAQANQVLDEHDALNAWQCYIIAACAGNKDLKMEQFMIFKAKREKTAEELCEFMDTWSVSTGGDRG